MHGYGPKPHLCSYPNCERSQPDNGFPRRYNLLDHMRRVHDHTGPIPTPDRVNSPIQAGVPALKRQNGHKRKAPRIAKPSKKRQQSVKAQAVSVPTLASQQRRVKGIQPYEADLRHGSEVHVADSAHTLPFGFILIDPPESAPSQTLRHHAGEHASQDSSSDSSEDAESHFQPRKRRESKHNRADVSSEEVLPTKRKPNNRNHGEQKRRNLIEVGFKEQQLVPKLNAGNHNKTQVLTSDESGERLEALEHGRAKELRTQWEERRALLQSRLQTMQAPQDITSHQQASEDIAALQRIANQLNEFN
ncbi:hypothetical protein H2199_003958 [Coniosporium tulheliwenetii]|uniref:Uncharacterized protein n=1 Tax=Coniosporium tulheliwenetii TaxID=3383036 RepID=A0ACC2Z9B3_9PEZI|nr:hypothetical protein H2199_003958 [Cladosporium sp. JES 115]